MTTDFTPAFAYTSMTYDLLREDLTTKTLGDLTARNRGLIQGGLEDLKTALDNDATDADLLKLIKQLEEDLAYATHDAGVDHAQHPVYDAFERAEKAWDMLEDAEELEMWYTDIIA